LKILLVPFTPADFIFYPSVPHPGRSFSGVHDDHFVVGFSFGQNRSIGLEWFLTHIIINDLHGLIKIMC
jgi:hypothetical protein